jgi:hypothetical protein
MSRSRIRISIFRSGDTAATVLGFVMRGHSASEDARKRAYDPRIHQKKKRFIQGDGLHRNSGLPELRGIVRRKSGKPDLRCQARQ